VHPRAVEVMGELGVDLSSNRPENVSEYLDQAFDYVITVCGGAKETCPTFQGKVGRNLHIGFDDPADATGTEEEILFEFRRIRDEIRRDFSKFYREQVLEN
jgi:arsenate reductase